MLEWKWRWSSKNTIVWGRQFLSARSSQWIGRSESTIERLSPALVVLLRFDSNTLLPSLSWLHVFSNEATCERSAKTRTTSHWTSSHPWSPEVETSAIFWSTPETLSRSCSTRRLSFEFRPLCEQRESWQDSHWNLGDVLLHHPIGSNSTGSRHTDSHNLRTGNYTSVPTILMLSNVINDQINWVSFLREHEILRRSARRGRKQLFWNSATSDQWNPHLIKTLYSAVDYWFGGLMCCVVDTRKDWLARFLSLNPSHLFILQWYLCSLVTPYLSNLLLPNMSNERRGDHRLIQLRLWPPSLTM